MTSYHPTSCNSQIYYIKKESLTMKDIKDLKLTIKNITMLIAMILRVLGRKIRTEYIQ